MTSDDRRRMQGSSTSLRIPHGGKRTEGGLRQQSIGGRYRIDRITGGDYLVIAVRGPRPGWTEKDYATLAPLAERVTLQDGERRGVGLARRNARGGRVIAAPAVVLLLSVSPQQAPPSPPPPPPIFTPQRDASSDAKGTAVIRGRVFTADGRPLRRVQVILRGSSISERIVGTGLEGEYEILDLPAGRFTLVARRGGYLPSDYGQRRYGEPGKPIDVTAGATLDGMNFTMERAGVISGRLTDETGEPVARASVYAMQSQFFRGRRQVVPVGAGHGTSDDSGSYRLPSLPQATTSSSRIPGDVDVGRARETTAHVCALVLPGDDVARRGGAREGRGRAGSGGD